MNVLEARGLRKSFGRHRAPTGVDLEIAAGDMVAVTRRAGPSLG